MRPANSFPVSPAPDWALPVKQARSERTRDRLLVAGLELLQKGGFDQTSIAALSQQAGCSVGAFYTRFPDKEAFYLALMAQVEAQLTQRMDDALCAPRLAGLSGPQTVDACLDALTGMFLDHIGLLRTVQRKGHDAQTAILPLQQLGKVLIDRMVASVAASHGREDDALFRSNAGVGFQIVIAVLLNSALNRPPRLNFDSPDFRFWLREVVLHAMSVRQAPQRTPPSTAIEPRSNRRVPA